MQTKITKNAFEYESLKYFRGNAHLVALGVFGEKKSPIGAKAYLDPSGHVKPAYLEGKVEVGTPVTIDWDRQTAADVDANGDLKYFGATGKVALKGNYQKAKSAHLKLISFSINENPLIRMLNKEADVARRNLADEGHDGRIVSEVWVVMEGKLADSFAAGGSVSYKADGDSLDVTANVSGQGSSTISLTPGATFAYTLSKVKDWSQGKKQIENMERDYKGLG